MFVVDTNILLYAADSDGPFHAVCREAVERWRSDASAWYLTWTVVYEFLAASTHRKTFREPWSQEQSWRFLGPLLESPGLQVLAPTDRHATVLAEVITSVPGLSGLQWHDARIAALMREHGIRTIYTRDTDFHRFPFLEVVDPTVPA